MSDAAIFPEKDISGASVVGLDHEGRCTIACCEPLQGELEPEFTEARALRRAICLALVENYNKVIFASDCLSLIERLHSSVHDRSSVSSVVADIKLVSTGFTSVAFKHVHS